MDTGAIPGPGAGEAGMVTMATPLPTGADGVDGDARRGMLTLQLTPLLTLMLTLMLTPTGEPGLWKMGRLGWMERLLWLCFPLLWLGRILGTQVIPVSSSLFILFSSISASILLRNHHIRHST